MNGSFERSLSEATAVEIDAKIVRGEAIRAIRGLMDRSSRFTESLSERSRPVSFYAVVRIMRDLELAITAMSEALAEGVGHAGGSCNPIQKTKVDKQLSPRRSANTETGEVERQAAKG